MDTFSILTKGKRLVEQEEILKIFGYHPRHTSVYDADIVSLIVYVPINQYCYRVHSLEHATVEPDKLIDYLITTQEERTK